MQDAPYDAGTRDGARAAALSSLRRKSQANRLVILGGPSETTEHAIDREMRRQQGR
jgi:hypothetical protein